MLKISLNKLVSSGVGALLFGGLAIAAAAAAPPQAGAPAGASAGGAGPGKAIVDRACQSCHDLGMVTEARHTAKQWPGVVERMRANGADLTDAEVKQVQDYLIQTYAKDK